MAAVAAVVVAAVAVAAVAVVVAVAAAAAVVAVVAVVSVYRLVVLAASAKPDRYPITLTSVKHFGRARHGRPGQFDVIPAMLPSSRARTSVSALDRRTGLRPYREIPARQLDEGIPVAGEYALHRRALAVGKVGVPIS